MPRSTHRCGRSRRPSRQLHRSDRLGYQIYPHEQVLRDIQGIQAAIADLQEDDAGHRGCPDPARQRRAHRLRALAELPSTCRPGAALPHVLPGDWGAQGHPIDYLDVIPQYDAIQGGTWNVQTIAQLQTMRDQDLADLNSRLNAMSATLELVTPQVNALR